MATSNFLNMLDDEKARAALTNCCAATRWVEHMLAARPFESDDAVHRAADEAFNTLSEEDWLEAFAGHPVIGDVESLREKYAATKRLAAGEQSGVTGADGNTLTELAAFNHNYLNRFGFIFIVFATGKTAAEMLAILRSRINNSREAEIYNAATEQQKISHLRLEKLASRTIP
jgi:2-oxo-4-hydroxy-4-carboxy-5-ureidoimidazoline decarboxylase